MRTLRYLLIVMSLVSVLSVKAQGITKLPEMQMQSTSRMASSGSSLPLSAVSGTSTTYNTQQQAQVGPRRERPGDNSRPYDDPIGDAMWPLMVCALAYLIIRVGRKRARA